MKRLLFLIFCTCAIIIISCKKDTANRKPVISVSVDHFSPDSGSYGTIVTIAGANLSQIDSVELNGKLCKINKKTQDSLIISIPKAAGSGDIRIVAGDSVFVAGYFGFHFTSYVITIAGSQNNTDIDGTGANAGFYGPNALAWDTSQEILL